MKYSSCDISLCHQGTHKHCVSIKHLSAHSIAIQTTAGAGELVEPAVHHPKGVRVEGPTFIAHRRVSHPMQQVQCVF